MVLKRTGRSCIWEGFEKMYHMKAAVMPHIYWRMVLEGVWDGPETYRKMMHMGRV